MLTAADRRWLGLAFGLALVVALPATMAGRFSDDHAHLAAIRGLPAPGAAPFELFGDPRSPDDVARLVDAGLYPWWTSPDLRLSFFRPLSSWLATTDEWLWPGNAPLAHLHSIAWYLVLLGGCAVVLRRLVPRVWGPALVLFAIDPTHAVTVAWLADRNALVAAAATIWGLAAHLRCREDGWRPGRWLALLGFAVGLAGGETAVGVLAYVVAYELIGGKPGRWRALAPATILLFAYLVMYRVTGRGAAGSGVYLDPLHAPLAFLAAAPARALVLIGAAILGLPADAAALGARTFMALVAGGVVALAILGTLVKMTWKSLAPDERGGLSWGLAGAALALLPSLAAFPASRTLLGPSLGVDAALACVLAAAWQTRAARRLTALVLAGVVAFAHLALPFAVWPITSHVIGTLGAREERVAAADLADDRVAKQSVVILIAPDATVGFHFVTLRALAGLPVPARVHVLSMAHADHRFTRTAPATLEMQVVDGPEPSLFEALVRDKPLVSRRCRATARLSRHRARSWAGPLRLRPFARRSRRGRALVARRRPASGDAACGGRESRLALGARGRALMLGLHAWALGIVLGLAIAAPVGPMALLAIRETLVRGLRTGFAASLGAATGDAFYGALAAVGLSVVADEVRRHEALLQIVGGVILCALAASSMRRRTRPEGEPRGHGAAYLAGLLVTASNPITILTFGAILLEARTDGSPLVVVGVWTGSFAWYAALCLAAHRLRERLSRRLRVVEGVTIAALWLGGLYALASGAVRLFGR